MARRDEREYADFVVGAQRRLRGTAYLLCGDWEHASDIVQEALIRVYVAWPRVGAQGGAFGYARRCVVTVAIDRSRRRSSTELPSAAVIDRADRHDPITAADDRATLVAALRAVAPRQRACLVLRFLEDLSVAETAQVLGCSEGNVKSQTARGLETLRRHLPIEEGAIR